MKTLKLTFVIDLKDGKQLQCDDEFDFDKDIDDEELVQTVQRYIFVSLHKSGERLADMKKWGVMCNYPFEWLIRGENCGSNVDIIFGCKDEKDFGRLASYNKIFKEITSLEVNQFLH